MRPILLKTLLPVLTIIVSSLFFGLYTCNGTMTSIGINSNAVAIPSGTVQGYTYECSGLEADSQPKNPTDHKFPILQVQETPLLEKTQKDPGRTVIKIDINLGNLAATLAAVYILPKVIFYALSPYSWPNMRRALLAAPQLTGNGLATSMALSSERLNGSILMEFIDLDYQNDEDCHHTNVLSIRRNKLLGCTNLPTEMSIMKKLQDMIVQEAELIAKERPLQLYGLEEFIMGKSIDRDAYIQMITKVTVDANIDIMIDELIELEKNNFITLQERISTAKSSPKSLLPTRIKDVEKEPNHNQVSHGILDRVATSCLSAFESDIVRIQDAHIWNYNDYQGRRPLPHFHYPSGDRMFTRKKIPDIRSQLEMYFRAGIADYLIRTYGLGIFANFARKPLEYCQPEYSGEVVTKALKIVRDVTCPESLEGAIPSEISKGAQTMAQTIALHVEAVSIGYQALIQLCESNQSGEANLDSKNISYFKELFENLKQKNVRIFIFRDEVVEYSDFSEERKEWEKTATARLAELFQLKEDHPLQLECINPREVPGFGTVSQQQDKDRIVIQSCINIRKAIKSDENLKEEMLVISNQPAQAQVLLQTGIPAICFGNSDKPSQETVVLMEAYKIARNAHASATNLASRTSAGMISFDA